LHPQQIYSKISLKVSAANIAARGEIVIPGRPVASTKRDMRCDFGDFRVVILTRFTAIRFDPPVMCAVRHQR
jgi:hypothetical protein